MNDLLGITKDSDVVNIRRTSIDIAMRYESDSSQGPTLKPMMPYFCKKPMEFDWNQRLAKLFVDRFRDEHKLELTTEDEDELEAMFGDRLIRLNRQLMLTIKKTEESAEDYRNRILEQKKAILRMKRPNTRRGQVSASLPR